MALDRSWSRHSFSVRELKQEKRTSPSLTSTGNNPGDSVFHHTTAGISTNDYESIGSVDFQVDKWTSASRWLHKYELCK